MYTCTVGLDIAQSRRLPGHAKLLAINLLEVEGRESALDNLRIAFGRLTQDDHCTECEKGESLFCLLR